MPAISIVIPVFNAADTLKQCVSSVITQSFEDWELLLVDDGSSDDSGAICSMFHDADPRIRFYSISHGGVSAARNTALEKAEGEHICFIDADDTVEPDYLSSLFQFKDYDMVLCGYYSDRYLENGQLCHRQKYLPDNLDFVSINNRKDLVPLFLSGMININCNKLLKTDIILRHRLRYPAYSVNEDYIFMLRYLEFCTSLITITRPLYHWTHICGKKSSLSSFSLDQIHIYNEAHLMTTAFFQDPVPAGKIFFYSYYWQILKSVKHIKMGDAHFRDLSVLMKNPLLKESFKLHSASSLGERIMLGLLSLKFYRTFYLLNNNLE